MKINKDKFIYEFTRNQATHEEIKAILAKVM